MYIYIYTHTLYTYIHIHIYMSLMSMYQNHMQWISFIYLFFYSYHSRMANASGATMLGHWLNACVRADTRAFYVLYTTYINYNNNHIIVVVVALINIIFNRCATHKMVKMLLLFFLSFNVFNMCSLWCVSQFNCEQVYVDFHEYTAHTCHAMSLKMFTIDFCTHLE